MKKILSLLLTCVAAVSLTACSQASGQESEQKEAEKVTVSHALGETEVIKNPGKVAVLDLGALDIMDALGLGDRVAGVPKKSSVSYLLSYNEDETVANLGSVKEVDMEKLNSLEPDLIIIGGRLSSEYDNLSKIAPTICIKVDHENGYMVSAKENVDIIASIFGMEEKANEFFDGFDERLAAIKEAAEGKTAILGLVTSGSLSTLGNGSRCSVITNEAGFENLAVEVDSTHGDSASFELLLDKNPDYMFILDRDTAINADGAKVAKEVMDNEIVQKTSAYQNGTIVYLTPDVWYLSEGGITATDTMLGDLEAGVLGR